MGYSGLLLILILGPQKKFLSMVAIIYSLLLFDLQKPISIVIKSRYSSADLEWEGLVDWLCGWRSSTHV